MYQLSHAGVDEATIVEECARRGRPIPKDILEQPELAPGLGLFYRAFMQLNSCRVSGMSPGPIPWTAILMWCNENEVDGRQRGMVFRYVREMDVAYLKYCADNSPS